MHMLMLGIIGWEITMKQRVNRATDVLEDLFADAKDQERRVKTRARRNWKKSAWWRDSPENTDDGAARRLSFVVGKKATSAVGELAKALRRSAHEHGQVIVLHETIEAALERGQKIDTLIDKSNDLSGSSKMFYKTAKKQKWMLCLMKWTWI